MKYNNVYIESIGYVLAPVVVTSAELEGKLAPLFDALHIPEGQIETLTGIYERRWWEPGYRLTDGAIAAGKRAIQMTSVRPDEIEVLLYTGVGREGFEPATACRIAAELEVSRAATVHDISNACLGMLSGIIDVANRIELGQIRAGLVVCCETARDIVETSIQRMINQGSLATMTGGSGAAAVLVTDGSFEYAQPCRRKLKYADVQTSPENHGLCRWGWKQNDSGRMEEVMETDAINLLKQGVLLSKRNWDAFLKEAIWRNEDVQKVITHQVGEKNHVELLRCMEIEEERDFSTYPYLGNMGPVSLPLTAALAEERNFLTAGDNVVFAGIGSGLNCMMLGLEW
jgi:acyl-CoA:acyl-CoA alkyltransferase